MAQRKKKSYPTTVLKLYIRLYCKKKNASKVKMMEAVKSWTTLKQCERDQFIKKYKECQINYKKKLANYLSKIQPYLKEKKSKRAFTNTTIREQTEGPGIEKEKLTSKESNSHDKVSITQNNSLLNMEEESQPVFQMDAFGTSYSDNEFSCSPPREIVTTYKKSSSTVLAEPSPPNAKNAKELYELLQSGNESSEAWSSLTTTQKIRYRKAVFLLKDNYIKKFKEYLKSLPPKELYDYYNNYTY
ncbi:hypothetical protein evm_013842 [Chilo suppressalis]|nr:hypothetical protein evm_013842 [Chilo suppressalis]